MIKVQITDILNHQGVLIIGSSGLDLLSHRKKACARKATVDWPEAL